MPATITRTIAGAWRPKRATDKGIEPPNPPGQFNDWLAANYPATFAYLAAAADKPANASAACSANIADCSANTRPKRSEAKNIPPIIPHDRSADAGQEAGASPGKGERKGWYAAELARLQQEFRPMLNTMLSNLQRPGASGEFGLVESFKGCWIQSDARGQPLEIVARSRQRAEAIMRQHGEWLAYRWPDLIVRHAKAEELRARPAK